MARVIHKNGCRVGIFLHRNQQLAQSKSADILAFIKPQRFLELRDRSFLIGGLSLPYEEQSKTKMRISRSRLSRHEFFQGCQGLLRLAVSFISVSQSNLQQLRLIGRRRLLDRILQGLDCHLRLARGDQDPTEFDGSGSEVRIDFQGLTKLFFGEPELLFLLVQGGESEMGADRVRFLLNCGLQLARGPRSIALGKKRYRQVVVSLPVWILQLDGCFKGLDSTPNPIFLGV